MNAGPRRDPAGRGQPGDTTARPAWAPWWVYLAVILGGNYLRQWLVPFGTVPEWADVVIALVLAGALFVLVTVAFRALRR